MRRSSFFWAMRNAWHNIYWNAKNPHAQSRIDCLWSEVSWLWYKKRHLIMIRAFLRYCWAQVKRLGWNLLWWQPFRCGHGAWFSQGCFWKGVWQTQFCNWLEDRARYYEDKEEVG